MRLDESAHRVKSASASLLRTVESYSGASASTNVPYPKPLYWLNDNLSFGHGHLVRTGSGDSVKAVLTDMQHSHFFGHIHRSEQASITRYKRGKAVTYTAICPGTIARLDDIVPAARSRNNWQQGLGFVYYEDVGPEYFQSVPVPINDGRALWLGRAIEGVDYLGDLRRDTGEEFRLPEGSALAA